MIKKTTEQISDWFDEEYEGEYQGRKDVEWVRVKDEIRMWQDIKDKLHPLYKDVISNINQLRVKNLMRICQRQINELSNAQKQNVSGNTGKQKLSSVSRGK